MHTSCGKRVLTRTENGMRALVPHPHRRRCRTRTQALAGNGLFGPFIAKRGHCQVALLSSHQRCGVRRVRLNGRIRFRSADRRRTCAKIRTLTQHVCGTEADTTTTTTSAYISALLGLRVCVWVCVSVYYAMFYRNVSLTERTMEPLRLKHHIKDTAHRTPVVMAHYGDDDHDPNDKLRRTWQN